MPEAKRLSLGGHVLPLDVDALEALPIPPSGTIRFNFNFRQITFTARYKQGDDADTGRLTLVGDLGPMPFTAESPAARAGLGQIMAHATDTLLGQTFRLIDNRICMTGALAVKPPVTATAIISAATTMLIPASPYLDLMAVYIRPPLAPAKRGESALQPQWRRRR